MATQIPVPISTTPLAGQLVEHQGKIYETVREGRAYILIPPNTQTSVNPQAKANADGSVDQPQNVFYNPIQQFNRDLSVLAIRAFGADCCAAKKRKHDLDKPKQRARKDKKRKRPLEDGDGDREDDKSVKSPKKAGDVVDSAEEQLTSCTTLDGTAPPQQAAGAPASTVSLDSGADNVNGDRPQNDEVPVIVEGLQNAEASGKTHHNSDLKPNGNQQPWKPPFRILDALSATGLRALRYATEIPDATAITANDMDRKAVSSIKLNVEHNGLMSIIQATTGNAMMHMYNAAFPPIDTHGPHHVSSKYDVIDLDPYGTAAPFIDSALQALNDGGLLCVTCTDSGVFASCGYSEKTYSLYGGMPVKGPHSHEGGLRIILHSIAAAAARYGLAIEPLLSLSIDFYVRLFVRVRKNPADVKFLSGKVMLVYECDVGCGAWSTQMLGRNVRQMGKNDTTWFKHSIAQAPSANQICEHCGTKTHIAGPMWAGPIHNAAFIERLLLDAQNADPDTYQTKARIEGMLDTALGELDVLQDISSIWPQPKNEDEAQHNIPKTPPEVLDLHPFFFMPSALSKVIRCQAPPEAAIKGALRHAGYKATRSHCKPGSIKTDAPWSAIWEVMREWVRQKSPIKEGALREGSAGARVMAAAKAADATGPDVSADAANTEAVDKDTEAEERAKRAKAGVPKRIKVVFDEALGRDKPGKRLVRYQQNPRENWGPMTRAKGSG